MIPVKFYAYVQFYSIHAFRGSPQMLMYSSYRRTKVHDGLVEDLGPHIDGFQDITVLKHLCAKVTGYDRKYTLWTHQKSWRNVYVKLCGRKLKPSNFSENNNDVELTSLYAVLRN